MDTRQISVVIPVLNEAETIAATVDSVLAGGFGEVVVVDGGSSDDTAIRSQVVGARVISAERGRAVQMNAGAAAAGGEVLLFLHADTRLPAHAAGLIARALSDPAVVGGCFRLSFDDPHPMLAVNAWCTRFDSWLTTWGDQAYFVRRAVFERLGGFPVMPLMEDYELRRRLRAEGRFVKAPAAVVPSARRFRKRGVVRQQLLNGALLAAYRLGVSAERLHRHYR